MNQIEKTYITNKLVDALNEATGLVEPEQRYAIYQDAMRLIAVLLKGSQPLSVYIAMFPELRFTEETSGIDVWPPAYSSLSRREALDWRNRLLHEGLGGLSLFRVRYAAGGYVEYAGESEESQAYDRILADYNATWKVFRPESTGFINLVRRLPVDIAIDPPIETPEAAERQAESLATSLKAKYPFEVIIVRIPLSAPIGTLTEIRVVKR